MLYKRWFVKFFLFLVFFVILFLYFNYTIDPFSLYKRSDIFLKEPNYHRYVNLGLIKHSDFDTLILGSSYIANFDTSLVNRLFDVNSQVISIYGASQKEITSTLQLALHHRPNLKAVFLDATIWNICNWSDHPTLGFPEKLYQGSFLENLKYLISYDTFLLALRKLIFLGKVLNIIDERYYLSRFFSKRFGTHHFCKSSKEIHPWYERYKNFFGNKTVLEDQLKKSPTKNKVFLKEEIEIEARKIASCFYNNIIKTIEKYTNIKFYIFNPPNYQWCLWQRNLSGMLPILLRAQEIIVNDLKLMKNVEYYDFYAATEIVNDCTRFQDFGHFDPKSSDFLICSIKEKKFQRTPKSNEEMTKKILKNLKEKASCPIPPLPQLRHKGKIKQ